MKIQIFRFFLTTTLCLFFFILAPIFEAQAITINSRVVKDRTRSDSLEARTLKLNPDISAEDLRSARSQYDPNLYGSFAYQKDSSERTSVVFGTSTTKTDFNLGVQQLAPTGTAFDLSFFNTKETTNSAFSTFPKFYDSRTQLQITQPLLNNAFGHNTRKNIKLAKKNKETTDIETQYKLMTLTYQNLSTYWNWYMNKHLVNVSQDALSAAIRLHRTNRQKMVIGLIEESDIYSFAANVDLKRSDLLDVENNLADAESNLRVAMNLTDDKLVLGRENMQAYSFPSPETMVAETLAIHPEYLSLKSKLEAQKILLAMNKNKRLPQIDLQGSLTLNGIDAANSKAIGDIADGHPIWQGGVNISFPLLNRQARASYNRSVLEKTQLLYNIKNTENRIVSQIRQGYDKYKTSLQRMKVVATAVEHQRLKWEGEITKYDQGRSDPDLVIRYQNDYLDTKKLYIQVQVQYQLAKLALNYYRGKL